MRTLHTLLESFAVFRQVAELSFEHAVEIIHMLFCPFDAGGHHDHWEARLVYQSCVFDDGEVYERDLVNVEMKIALKDALPGRNVSLQLQFSRRN